MGGNLGTADDHHEYFVRTDQRNRRPRGDRGACQAMAQSVRDVGCESRRNPEARSQRTSAGTCVARRAESSITIELA